MYYTYTHDGQTRTATRTRALGTLVNFVDGASNNKANVESEKQSLETKKKLWLAPTK